MSAPIDVLAVLRSQLAWIGPCRPDGDEIDCARWDRIESSIAALEDLIEAARSVEISCVRHDGNDAELFRRLYAALTRAQGGAA